MQQIRRQWFEEKLLALFQNQRSNAYSRSARNSSVDKSYKQIIMLSAHCQGYAMFDYNMLT